VLSDLDFDLCKKVQFKLMTQFDFVPLITNVIRHRLQVLNLKMFVFVEDCFFDVSAIAYFNSPNVNKKTFVYKNEKQKYDD
jgi:hypothetical protein